MIKITKQDFIKKCELIHGNLYDYSNIDYVNNTHKIVLNCNLHGDFQITPKEHKKGRICPKCSLIIQGEKCTNRFLEKKFKYIVQPSEHKLIPLNKGLFAKVDNEDFDKLKTHNWSITVAGYAENRILKLMHRFIMNYPEDMVIDHINGDKLDNRKSNLRVCTQQENTCNRNNTSAEIQYIGIFKTNSNKYKSEIKVDGKIIRLGHYKTQKEALEKRNEFITENNLEYYNVQQYIGEI